MRLSWFRLNYKWQFSFIVAGVFVLILSLFPNYDAILYSLTKAVNADEYNFVGYPAGDGVSVLKSKEEIVDERHVFTIETDAQKIKPLGIYLSLDKKGVSKKRSPRWLIFDEPDKMKGQYYLAELDNGDSIVVFLDDFAVKLPKDGRVKLPRGKVELMGKTSQSYLLEKTDLVKDDLKYYVDMSGTWRSGSMAKKGYVIRVIIAVIGLLVVAPITFVIVWKIEKKENIKSEELRKARQEKWKAKEEGKQNGV